MASDGEISQQELKGLEQWLERNADLKSTWPYDEVETLVSRLLRESGMDGRAKQALRDLCLEFVALLDDRVVGDPIVKKGRHFVGMCALTPEITIRDHAFAISGASARWSRKQFTEKLECLGARVMTTVSGSVDYLIVCNEGNPHWSYACYGRKIEKAVSLRKAGHRLVILHENDLHDEIADLNAKVRKSKSSR